MSNDFCISINRHVLYSTAPYSATSAFTLTRLFTMPITATCLFCTYFIFVIKTFISATRAQFLSCNFSFFHLFDILIDLSQLSLLGEYIYFFNTLFVHSFVQIEMFLFIYYNLHWEAILYRLISACFRVMYLPFVCVYFDFVYYFL